MAFTAHRSVVALKRPVVINEPFHDSLQVGADVTVTRFVAVQLEQLERDRCDAVREQLRRAAGRGSESSG